MLNNQFKCGTPPTLSVQIIVEMKQYDRLNRQDFCTDSSILLTSQAGSGIKMEEDQLNIWNIAAL